jgi:hypothetical protein
MAQQQLIMAIGRIERALSRLEQVPARSPAGQSDAGLTDRHEQLKAETKAALDDIDRILAGGAD